MSRVTPEGLARHIDRKMRDWETEGVSMGPEGTIWVGGVRLGLRAVFDYGVKGGAEEKVASE